MNTMPNAIETAFAKPMLVGECPLWHAPESALYWVDIPGFAVHRLHPASGAHQRWIMPSEPAALALSASGGLIVAMRSGFWHLDTGKTSSVLRQIAAAPYDTATARCNDGRCDAAGRFWVGTLYEPRDQQSAQMLCLDHGVVRLAWSGGMTVSNGLAFSPDSKTMYHADTTSHTIRSFDFDLTRGQADNMRILKQFASDKSSPHYGGRPDGAAVDSEGAYWCAMFEGARLLRLAPDGEILREIALPVRCPTMLAFGGDDLRTLYITSASEKRPAAELAQYPLSGCLLSLRVDVAGREEAAYIE
jgi:sugar lactone lactonase YvrE